MNLNCHFTSYQVFSFFFCQRSTVASETTAPALSAFAFLALLSGQTRGEAAGNRRCTPPNGRGPHQRPTLPAQRHMSTSSVTSAYASQGGGRRAEPRTQGEGLRPSRRSPKWATAHRLNLMAVDSLAPLVPMTATQMPCVTVKFTSTVMGCPSRRTESPRTT